MLRRFLFRVVFPLTLGTACLTRQNGFSLLYLVLCLLVPWIPMAPPKQGRGAPETFLGVSVGLSGLILLSQATFQIVLMSMSPYGHFLQACEFLESILRQTGFEKLDRLPIQAVVRIWAPDLLVFFASAGLLGWLRHLLSTPEPSNPSNPSNIEAPIVSLPPTKLQSVIPTGLAQILSLAALWAAGALYPSALNGLYFITFLAAATWWAMGRSLGKAYGVFLSILVPFVALHCLVVFLIELPVVQDFLGVKCFFCSYLGVMPLRTADCNGDPRIPLAKPLPWSQFANPTALLVLYHALLVAARVSIFPTKRAAATLGTSAGSAVTSSSLDTSNNAPLVQQDAHGSMVLAPSSSAVDPESISLRRLSQNDAGESDGISDGEGNSCWPRLNRLATIIGNLLARGSYVLGNVSMLAWSITFHSWLGFILLLWSSVLWLLPNQRRAMLRCSPLLGLYTTALLLSQYIYSIDVSEEDLPRRILGLSVVQLGLVGPGGPEARIKALFIKTCFTAVVWLVLRDRARSNAQAKNYTATRLPVFMSQVHSILTLSWIWLVAGMLLLIGLVGAHMTVFRIVYMALFLLFILMFQLSYRAWRRMLYPFWILLIAYSMTLLVAVYTYQFDGFPDYWREYLHIPDTLQEDMGLQKFEAAKLFIGLLTPTFFLVITVIQVHYFHDNFMELSDISASSRARAASANSATSDVLLNVDSNEPTSPEVEAPEPTTTTRPGWMGLATLAKMRSLGRRQGSKILYLGLLLLELHADKATALALMVASMATVRASHAVLLQLCLLAVVCTGRGLFLRLASIWTSLLVLLSMLYQMEYVDSSLYDTACPTFKNETSRDTVTLNNAEWMGFYKGSTKLGGYIGFLLVATGRAILLVWQIHRRGSLSRRPAVPFPSVNRSLADKDLKSCAQFLLNYAFYKFGVEVCLVAIVALISVRMDLFALLHAFWLLGLFALDRKRLSSVWRWYQIFLVITILIQYFFAIGPPPVTCLTKFPWGDVELLNQWLFPTNNLILCLDFAVLILVTRQATVFAREGLQHPGGSNEPVDLDSISENPTPNYFSPGGSWINPVKRIIFSSALWVTLAVLFLAGTMRISLFSLGYLMAAFVFLWHGEDLYLRPSALIIRKWNYLITYNALVIALKVLMQVGACVFAEDLRKHACFLTKLLSVACAQISQQDLTTVTIPDDTEETCDYSSEEIDLKWDAVCFALLIAMRRLFGSYFFAHLVNQAKAMEVLASRGAELIEHLRVQQIRQQRETERRLVDKIKSKMERIKATQAARASIGGVPEPPTHFAGTAAADAEVAAATAAAAARSGTTTPDAAATAASFHTPLEEEPPLGAHSPFSALHTGSLDGYLEPQRLMSWGSPPPESFPVFSPPPYGVAVRERPPGPPWMPLVTPRASLCLSSPRSHQTYDHKDGPSELKRKPSSYVDAIRSGDYYMFERIGRDDELEEPPSESEEDETEPLTISKLVSSAIRTDIDAATDLAKQQKRRASMPPPRDAQRSSYFSALSTLSAPASSVPQTAHTTPPQPESSLEPTSPRSGLPGDSSSPPNGDDDGDDRGAGGDLLPDDETSRSPSAPSWRSRVISYARFTWAFIESAMESATRALNKLSRDYRYVHRVLEDEKGQLIASSSFATQGSRVGPENVWAPHYGSRPQLNDEEDDPETGLIIPEIKVTRCTPGGTQPPSASGTRLPSLEELEVIEAPKRAQPAAIRLLLAIWFAIIAHSDLLCYLAVFVNQIHSASILSIPLPFMVFLWGTLSVPRPTKTFWVTLIAYTEAIVVVKSIFQFPIFSWNTHAIAETNVFYPPRLIGVYEARKLFKYDLMLLLVIFFHRYMLKSLGLWTNKDPPPLPEGLHAMDVAGDESSEGTPGVAGAAAAAAQLITPGGIALIRPRAPPPDERSPLRRPDIAKYTSEKPIQEGSGSGDPPSVEMALVAVAPVSLGPRRALSGWSQYIKSVKLHFTELLESGTRVSTDVYAYMFLCDFFNFLVVIFGFSSFGTQTGDGGVASYLQDNKVPIPFLVMLILQFMLIVFDRALYLRKHILGKIIFQYCLIFGVHIWMFFVLPAVTERPFTARTLPQVWYVVKCVYLLLSAYQIRSGYPGRILGNFLCKRYNLVNMISFKIFMLIPFVFELRALMDWVWTDTSLALMDWLKMEDIFANVFQLKCGRKLEDRFPSPRGQKKGLIVKYAMGGGFLLIIIGIIWFPLVFFALGNSVGQSHPPDEIRVEIRIGHYEPIYHTMILKEEGNLLSEHSSWEEFQNAFWKDRTAQTFLASYDASDVLSVQLDKASAVTWSWPEPDRVSLAESLTKNTLPIPIRLAWNIRRSSNNPQVPEQATESLNYVLEPGDERRVALRHLLYNASSTSLRIPMIWPKFIKVTNRGTAAPITQLDGLEPNAVLFPIELRLRNTTDGSLWWELTDPCDMHTPTQLKFDKLPFNPQKCDGGILFYTFNDKQFPATLNFLSGGGIIGLYTTMVLLAGRVIRSLLTGMSLGIMWKEWPNVDRILKLCLDIYLVRESLELALEEDLFAKLVFLYRSPETLIKWTRPKEEGEPEGEGDQQ